ncbi:hypothetical protein D3C78_1329660 [compost metagenome]
MRHMARGADMDVQRRPGAHGRVGGGQQRQRHIDMARGQEAARIRDPVAARDCALVDARQVQRATLAGCAGLAGLVLRMNAAHAHARARRHQPQIGRVVARADLARVRRAGHHRAVARQREHAVHGQPEQARRIALTQRFGLRVQIGVEFGRGGVAGL